MADLRTEYVGLTLRNPVVVASAGITETAARIKRAADAGAGAVVMKSFFEPQYARQSPTPRFRVLKPRIGRARALTLYSFEQASPFSEEEYAAEIARSKKAVSIPVIASLSCLSDEMWRRAARLVAEAGADAIECNASCPYGMHTLGACDFAGESARVTALVKGEVAIPVIPKMTPQLSDPVAVALGLQAAGANGVVMFNRFTGLDIDLEQERPIMHGGYAGHGGPWALQYTLRWIAAASPRLGIPVAASGGVGSGEDVAKLILAGATVTETCAAVVLGGYGAIRKLVNGLEDFMVAKGYKTLAEFRGKVCDRILPSEEVERRRVCVARIDMAKCSRCDTCFKVCIYDAVDKSTGDYIVTRDACSGCGLCVELCPRDAIEMTAL